MQKYDVDVEPDYDGGSGVYIRARGSEIVSWTEDEWFGERSDGGTTTTAIAKAIADGHEHGATALARSIGKKWNAQSRRWEVIR